MLTTTAGQVETLNLGLGVGHVQGVRLYDSAGNLLLRGASTATVTQVVADGTSAKTLKALNAARQGLIIHNKTTATLTIKLGSTPSASSLSDVIPPFTSWDCPPTYQGIITGFFSGADGTTDNAAYVTEW